MNLQDILGKGGSSGEEADTQKALAELYSFTAEPESYRPMIIRPKAQMGLTVIPADGRTRRGFYYHTLRQPLHQLRGGEEFLSFISEGTAVVVQGAGLLVLYTALMCCTLEEVREYDGRPINDATATKITHLAIADSQDKRGKEPQLTLVK